MACARIVSATGLACAAAIGAAPRMIRPIAPTEATDSMLAAATDWRTAAGRARSSASRARSRQLASGAAAAAGSAAAISARSQGEIPGDGDERHRDHAVGVGAQAAEEAEVLDQYPVGQAQHGEADEHRPDQPRLAGQENRAGDGERGDGEQVDREAVRLVESGERGDPGGQDMRLRCWRHRRGHSRQGARLAVRGALPESAARPRLQDRHADQEQAQARPGSAGPAAGCARSAREARSGRLPRQ